MMMMIKKNLVYGSEMRFIKNKINKNIPFIFHFCVIGWRIYLYLDSCKRGNQKSLASHASDISLFYFSIQRDRGRKPKKKKKKKGKKNPLVTDTALKKLAAIKVFEYKCRKCFNIVYLNFSMNQKKIIKNLYSSF